MEVVVVVGTETATNATTEVVKVFEDSDPIFESLVSPTET